MYVSSAACAPFLEAMATASVENLRVAGARVAEIAKDYRTADQHAAFSRKLSASTVYLNFDPIVIFFSLSMPFVMLGISQLISALYFS